MDDKIILEKSRTIKKSKTPTKTVFMLYSLRKFTIEPATSEKIDTELIVFLPKNSGGILHQNLKLMKLINFFMESMVYGWKY